MTYGARFDEALSYASSTTREHHPYRKGPGRIPYVTHLLAVAALVGEAGGSEDEVIAALLHDIVEDCGGRPRAEEVRRKFGDRVAQIVLECSDSDVDLTEADAEKAPWKDRKQQYIDHLDSASRGALLVSCADKAHNARSIAADLRETGDEVWSRFSAPKDQVLWYYRALREKFRARREELPPRLLDELERSLKSMEDFAGSSRIN